MTWRPQRILMPIEARKTGSGVLRVETEQGEGFLKAMGADNGPHVLACELVGTLLAKRLGLRTLDFSLIDVPGDLDLRFANGKAVEAGPGFITRAEEGQPWSGDPSVLTAIENPHDVGLLVVFDTWTRNCDRYRPANGATLRQNKDNVWLSEEGAGKGKFVLKAIDHGCCFTCESEITRPQLQRTMHDDRLYGLFPGFRPQTSREGVLQGVTAVEAIRREEVEGFIRQTPRQWQVESAVSVEWCDWICQRGKSLRRIIEREWPPVTLTDLISDEGQR
jgi:hypothetical protein